MRVIAGSARRILLTTVDGADTRPTTDRIKETLFNMIHNDIYGSSFLDLYSGSGAIGIEALSRGAKTATFVENNRAALACIKKNLKVTRLDTEGKVINGSVMTVLKQLEFNQESYDFIFMDPPYGKKHEMEVLQYLNNSALIHEDTSIIVESSLDTNFDYVDNMNLYIYKIKKYKTNQHLYLRKKDSEETI